MRRLWILFLMAIMVLIVGCQKQNPDINSTITQDSNINSAADQVHHETPFMIILRSSEELEKMRNMSATKDFEKLEEYLFTLGLSSKSEIDDFLRVYDSLPILNLIDGEVCLIMRQSGTVKTKDENGNYYDTGESYDKMYITIESNDGSWVRMNYYLSEDISVLEKQYTEGYFGDYALTKPLLVSDDRICVYSEKQEYSKVEDDEVVVWNMSIDGIYVEVVYCSNDLSEVSTTSIFENISICKGQNS